MGVTHIAQPVCPAPHGYGPGARRRARRRPRCYRSPKRERLASCRPVVRVPRAVTLRRCGGPTPAALTHAGSPGATPVWFPVETSPVPVSHQQQPGARPHDGDAAQAPPEEHASFDRRGSMFAPETTRPTSEASYRLRALASLSGALTDPLSPAEASRIVSDLGLATLGAASASVVTLGPFPPDRQAGAPHALHVVASVGVAAEAAERWRSFGADAQLPIALVVRTGKALYFGSRQAMLAAFPLLADEVARGDHHAFAVVPVWGNGHLRGAFALSWAGEREFDDDERAFVQTLGTMCAQAILRAHLAERERLIAARYSTLIAATTQIVWTATPDGYYAGRQASWSDFTGQRPEDAVDMGWVEAIHPDDRVEHLMQWLEAVAAGRPFEGEVRVLAASGEWRHMQVRAAPVRDATGAIVEWVGVDTDVTERWRARADMEAAHAEAIEANKAKSEFLATMSHELRTPLTAVVGYTELLAEEIAGPITPMQRMQLERVRASSEQLLILVEDLLSFARLEGGREQVIIEPFVLADVVRDALAVVEPLMEKRQLALRVDVPAGAVTLVTDQPKLRQVLVNLLANAAKFTERGEVTLQARVAGDELDVRVRDTGHGIAREHWDRVFDTFWQVDQKLTRRIGGTGLGLSVARQLARLLGGDVQVLTSEIGLGTTFGITVPLRLPGAGARPGAARTSDPATRDT
jgi:PAS domain S-box-containing protein